MSARLHCRGVGRRAAACLAIAGCALAGTAATASADTPFGGNPEGTVSTEASCGPTSCTLYWTGPGGTDLAPIAASGGSGTITSVTLPAMPAPGTMQAVVLTSSPQASQPGSGCCQVKELSAPFTVPANQMTTLPLSLHVSATGATNPGMPGATPTGDGVGISLLTPNASTPLHATENPSDALSFWAPALTAPSSSFESPSGEAVGYELAVRFNFTPARVTNGPTPGPPAPGGSSPGAAPKAGVKLNRSKFRIGRDGRTLMLGEATNPPTASTKQTLTAPAPAPEAAAAASAGKAKKPLILGTGKTTVPSGRSAPIKLTLNPKGRAALAKGHSLKATLTVVATNAEGESQTVTKRVTIRPAAKPKR